MERGRFLSNIPDPTQPETKRDFIYSYDARLNGPAAMDQEWEQHMKWINSHIVGPPEASKWYTREFLEDQGLVGIYAHAETNPEKTSEAASNNNQSTIIDNQSLGGAA